MTSSLGSALDMGRSTTGFSSDDFDLPGRPRQVSYENAPPPDPLRSLMQGQEKILSRLEETIGRFDRHLFKNENNSSLMGELSQDVKRLGKAFNDSPSFHGNMACPQKLEVAPQKIDVAHQVSNPVQHVGSLQSDGTSSLMMEPANSNRIGPSQSEAVASALSQGARPFLRRASGCAAWPTTIQMREELAKMKRDTEHDAISFDDLKQVKKALHIAMAGSMRMTESLSLGLDDILGRGQTASRGFVVNPLSHRMLVYDVISLIVLLQDFVTIPYVLAWREQASRTWFSVLNWLSFLFWFSDIGVQLFTGYISDGQMEMKWKKVVRHYFTTWFLFDAPLVTIDLISAIGNTSGVDLGDEICRIFLFLRVITLLRAWRLMRTFTHLVERDLSDSQRAAFYILKVFIAIVWLGHVICCAWYKIGKEAHTGTGHRWFDTVQLDEQIHEQLFLETSLGYQYVTAFHWALSQVAGTGVEMISPTNTMERIFNISICVFQILFGTFLVSSLSATMIEVQIANQDNLKKMRQIHQFLSQNGIHPQLAIRVQRQIKGRLWQPKRFSYEEVPALQMLSKKIRMELQFATVGVHLLRHPLYKLCAQIDSTAVETFCYEAVTVMHCLPGEVIFLHSEEAKHCYYVIQGQCMYTQSPLCCAYVDEESHTPVTPGSWMCRAALWSCWHHVGNAEAELASELLTISAAGTLAVMLKHPLMGDILREYGYQFHSRLIAATPPLADFPSDLHVPFTDYKEMVLAMKTDIRAIVGVVALSHLQAEINNNWFSANPYQLQKLERELISGKSTIMVTEDDRVQRVVALSALHLENADGRVLIQVGKLLEGTISCKCCWPGTSLGEGETPLVAVQRFIQEELPQFKAALCWRADLHYTKEVEKKVSPMYGIMTEYIKTYFYASLDQAALLVPAHAQRLVPKTTDQPVRFLNRQTRKQGSKGAIKVIPPRRATGIVPAPRETGPNLDGADSSPVEELDRQWSPQLSTSLDISEMNDVFVLNAGERNSRQNIYAWVTKDQFQTMRDPLNVEDLQRWLQSYELENQERPLIVRSESPSPSMCPPCDRTPSGGERSSRMTSLLSRFSVVKDAEVSQPTSAWSRRITESANNSMKLG